MILIVDDDDGILDMLSERLREMGYSVKTAHETLQAYRKLKDKNCRLMILDLNMPKINGAELLFQSLRRRFQTLVVSGQNAYYQLNRFRIT